jgi:hypothetical protein
VSVNAEESVTVPLTTISEAVVAAPSWGSFTTSTGA